VGNFKPALSGEFHTGADTRLAEIGWTRVKGGYSNAGSCVACSRRSTVIQRSAATLPPRSTRGIALKD